ncbi:hypothetical protein ACKKBG_A17460 [Auxenochlorella protothecoides x Auxenochlorella symbiontica]
MSNLNTPGMNAATNLTPHRCACIFPHPVYGSKVNLPVMAADRGSRQHSHAGRRSGPRTPTAVASPERAALQPHMAGHTDLINGLGYVGSVPTSLMPWLLRLSHIRSSISGSDTADALQDAACGLLIWQAALQEGLVPDDETLVAMAENPGFVGGDRKLEDLRWPDEPLRAALLRGVTVLGVGRFAKKYPAVLQALLKSLVQVVCQYQKTVSGLIEEEGRARDASGNVYKTIAELQAEEAARRAEGGKQGIRNPNVVAADGKPRAPVPGQPQPGNSEVEEEEPDSTEPKTKEEEAAQKLVAALVKMWREPLTTLSRAGRAFEGMEALLGGGRGDPNAFDLGGGIWGRKGWTAMDALREKLEDVKELRDLVRSLGRGGGWGPLRRAPTQYLDDRGRPGLLRTVLEAQETRGLTRGDDLSRMLPSEAALLARGRTVRQARLLFFAKLAEQALQCYERDGWSEFPTSTVPERREVRPTAERGPILLCVDTSGSMRGPRETVAKALALECMRAAKAQDRACYVFAFAGLQEVRELELNMDMKSIHNLLDFLEKTFNGGSDFNSPIKLCLSRLTDAKWANSDILLVMLWTGGGGTSLGICRQVATETGACVNCIQVQPDASPFPPQVSDGELRQPGVEIMRKLAGAKDKLSLRVHGLILGSPEKKRADPAVLRSLCSHTLPNGKNEVLVHEFADWASVKKDRSLTFDWDDALGNAARREAGLRLEKMRNAEMKRRRLAERQKGGSGLKGEATKILRMPSKDASSFDEKGPKGKSNQRKAITFDR